MSLRSTPRKKKTTNNENTERRKNEKIKTTQSLKNDENINPRRKLSIKDKVALRWHHQPYNIRRWWTNVNTPQKGQMEDIKTRRGWRHRCNDKNKRDTTSSWWVKDDIEETMTRRGRFTGYGRGGGGSIYWERKENHNKRKNTYPQTSYCNTSLGIVSGRLNKKENQCQGFVVSFTFMLMRLRQRGFFPTPR